MCSLCKNVYNQKQFLYSLQKNNVLNMHDLKVLNVNHD